MALAACKHICPDKLEHYCDLLTISMSSLSSGISVHDNVSVDDGISMVHLHLIVTVFTIQFRMSLKGRSFNS